MDPIRKIRRQNDDESSTTGRGIAGSSTTATTAAPATTVPTSVSEASTTAQTTPPPETTADAEETTTAEQTTTRMTTASRSTVTQVITPTTVIVIGTETITSALPATTLTSTTEPLVTEVPSSNNNSSISSGARAGIIAGSVVGGLALAAIFLLVCLGMRRKRRKNLDRQENIKWPEIAASAEDRAALYPEQTHATGRAGIGGDDMEEVRGAPAMMAAGAAGVGTAYAGAGRWNSTSTDGRQPTLPSIPPSAYTESSYRGMSQYSSAPPSSYGGTYGAGSASNQSHAPLAPGPASIDYQRSSPSPPRTYVPGGSSNGHGDANGALPLPGSELEQGEVDRPSSPTPLQVGPFGNGYDESGKGWRLSVVNDDPRERE